MLRQYRRHTKNCTKKYGQHDRSHHDCRCCIYVEGRLNRFSSYLKESTGSRNWQTVRRMIVASEDQGVWPPPSADSISNNDEIQDQKTITDAIDAFLSELVSERGRNVSKPTAGKYETLLRRLKVFCVDRGLRVTPEIKLADLQIFKDTWPTGSRATKNNIQRLRSFFRFCCGQTWLMENPAQKLEMPKNIKSTQKLPYTDEEMSRILRSALSIRLHKQQAVDNHDLYAFILAMRYTGLRISDAGLLTVDRIHDNALFLYAIKNGAHVY